MRLRALLIVALLAVAVLWLSGQEFRATINGTVTDPTGAVVPGVTVEIRNLATNALITTQTNESGIYVAPFIPPGRYTVSASREGFKRAVREDVEVRVGDRLRIDFQLELGGVTERVVVSASAELLETSTAARGQVIDSQKVAEMPLLGRNPFMLAVLAPAVQYTPSLASRSNRPFDNGGMDSFSINGGRQFTNEFLIDGVPNTGTETNQPGNLSFVPSPDATEEFKVQTNVYDAQYGRTGGGVINVSLRSGTNDFHGALYHYFRHDKLNANTFEANQAGSPKQSFRWNQPGLRFDGPVWIPRVYDGRNRTFFMYSWERIKSSIPFPQTMTVPTLEQRAGDFSKTVQANGQPILVYDPATIRASGSGWVRDPFPGNLVPQVRWDPVSKNLLNYIPKPNTAGDARGFFNLVIAPNPRTDLYDQHVVRIDQVIGSRHRLFGRFLHGNRHETNSTAGFPREASAWYNHWRINQGGGIDLTSTLSPSLVSSFRIGYIRHEFAVAHHADGFDPAQLGFPASLSAQLPRKSFPRITYTDYTTFGPNWGSGSVFSFSDQWSLQETLNKVISRHSLKFGFEGRLKLDNQQNPASWFGVFSFTKGFTQRDPLRSEAAAGNSFASLLLGYPASGYVPIRPDLALGSRYSALFLQDDWRITNRLTLNLGLRWDYESPITERFDRQNRGFDWTAPSPLQVPGLDLKGRLLFTDSSHRLPFDRDLNNFQPRIGAAYQLTSKTVLRGGWGISYLPTFDVGQFNGFSIDTPYVESVDGGLTPAGQWNNPYPSGIIQPLGRQATMLGLSFTYSWPQRVIPYVHQYSFGIQHELPWRVLIDVSYVGSRTLSLQTSKGINAVPADKLALRDALLAKVPNPFAGLLPGTAFNGATVPQQQLLRPFPQYNDITEANRTIGKSWYDSFQLRVEKRLSHGFHALFSYTISKTLEAVGYLNAQDPFGALAKVLTAFDTPQRATLSGGYELPFGKTSHGVMKQVIGGWQLNWIATFQTGLPINAPGGAVSTGVNPRINNPTSARWFNTCTLTLAGVRQSCASADEPVAWLVQDPYALRTLSTRLPNIRTLRAPLVDFSVFKMFPITERVRMQFRAEAFNLTNTPWFGAPNTTLGSANFGVVSPSQANDPRNVQLSLRLQF
ncbi:MAG: TonB-dependent receptor domain-containing protein [Bryobacteraceae bacterium]